MCLKWIVCVFCVVQYALLAGAISGGPESNIDQRPYFASLQYRVGSNTTHFCGASIVSTKFLLSAASCDPQDEASMAVAYARVGSIAHTNGGQAVKLASFVRHPQYDETTAEYDFAVVTLAAGVEIVLTESSVRVIPLARSEPEDNELMSVVGCGMTRVNGTTFPINFREATFPVVNQIQCTRVHNSVTPNQICAGGCVEGRFGVCQGDEGGPAVFYYTDPEIQITQFGVISKIQGCGVPRMYDIYGRVSKVIDWIEGIIQG